MGLTGLDIAVLLVVGIAAVLGFMRGFVSEAMSLAAWLVAIAAVKLLHAPVAALLIRPIGTETGAAVLAFAIVFGLTFLAVRMTGRALGRATRSSLLGPFDRVLGFGFGTVKGLVAASLVFLFVALILDTARGFGTPRPAWMVKARTYPLLRASSTAIADFVEARRKP